MDDLDIPDKQDPPPFSEHFASSIALSVFDPDTICESFGVDTRVMQMLMRDPSFQETVTRYQIQFQKEGVTAQTKARMAVELMIPHMVRLGTKLATEGDPDGHKIFDSLAKVGNMYSKASTGEGGDIGGFMLRIDLTEGKVIDVGDIETIQSGMPEIDVTAAG